MRSRSAGRNRIEHVRRRDEQHLRQIERHVEVVIAERVVLLRIEHLEQRRRRIAAEVGAELVDLVEDEHRVLRLGAAQPLDDLARAARRCRCAGGRGSPPRRACRRATRARTCGRATRRSTARATSCRRREGRRSRGSAPSRPGSACGRRGTRGCDPSPSRGPSDRRRARSWSAADR